MSWKDKLRKATFRDVPFLVDGNDLAGGRRLVEHEYPQRNKPYVEDLGRKIRDFSVQGFVIGIEYMDARDALLSAIEADGPGTLVHPYFGTLTVNVKDYRCAENPRDGGMARLSITFVESGELEFPTGGVNTGAQVRIGTETARTSAITDFSKVFKVVGAPDFVGSSANSQLTSGMGVLSSQLKSISTIASQAMGALAVATTLSSLVKSPVSLATSIFGAMNSISPDLAGLAGSSGNLLGVARSLLTMANGFTDPAPLPSGVYLSAGRQQQYDNTIATNALFRRSALLASADVVSLSEFPVYDDAVAMRADLSAALIAEAVIASDDVFAELTDVRVQMRKDVADRSRGAARLQTIVPADILPAVAIAYDLYEDSSRDDEIVMRNGIVHPGFVRQEPLKVLSV